MAGEGSDGGRLGMFSGRFAPQTYALMRIIFGLTFMSFGLQKFGMLGGHAVPLGSLVGAAALIELVGGLLIAIGFLTQPAAFIASGEMAVAYFMAHQPHGILPVQNHGTPAVLYCFAFLHIAARGAGVWSVEQARKNFPGTA